MASTNWLVYARKAFTTYSNWQRVTGPKNWPKGTAFRIVEIRRAGSTIWVRSAAAGWAIFDNSLFEDANCHPGARVYATPYEPTNRPWGNGPWPPQGNHRLYAAYTSHPPGSNTLHYFAAHWQPTPTT